MDKKKFDKIMNEWITHEMKAAPDLMPSPEVYQKLEDGVRKSKVSFFSWPVRLAAAGIAAALIILVIVLQPPKEVDPLLGLRKGAVTDIAEKAEVEDRMQVLGEEPVEEQTKDFVKPDKVGKAERAKIQEKVEEGIEQEGDQITEYDAPPAKIEIAKKVVDVTEADKEAIAQPQEVAARPRLEITPEKKAKSETKMSRLAAAAPSVAVSERVEFQYQFKGLDSFVSLNIDSPQDEIVSLASEDNYRLSLELPQERFVYVFQVGADKQLTKLFPNPEYNPVQNPVQAGNKIIIPSSPDWFYVEKGRGEVLIYVVSSAEPLQDWEDLDAIIAMGRQDQLEKGRGDQVSVRVFKFNIH